MPPYATGIAVPFHIPVVIVPMVANVAADVRLPSVVMDATDVVPTSMVLSKLALYVVGKSLCLSVELRSVNAPNDPSAVID